MAEYSHFAVAVRDVKLDGFALPMFVPRLGMAERMFSDEVQREDSQLKAHPEDYSLYHVGWFNEDSGMLIPLDVPQLIIQAAACVRPVM